MIRSEMDDLKQLLNSYVTDILLNEDKTMIRFELCNRSLIYTSWGDCCAQIYFEDIEYPAKKPDQYGYSIQSVEVVEEYGYRIKTQVGDIVISGRYADSSGWGGYEVGTALWAVIPKDIEKENWTKFEEVKPK